MTFDGTNAEKAKCASRIDVLGDARAEPLMFNGRCQSEIKLANETKNLLELNKGKKKKTLEIFIGLVCWNDKF